MSYLIRDGARFNDANYAARRANYLFTAFRISMIKIYICIYIVYAFQLPAICGLNSRNKRPYTIIDIYMYIFIVETFERETS